MEPVALAGLVLRAATDIVDGVQRGLQAHGFTDVRPAHGFAFVRISVGGATTADIAAHLGVTKQAASQLVEQLVERGYVERTTSTVDRRARLLTLTERGWACTRAADDAAATTVSAWTDVLGPATVATLQDALARVVRAGPVRPAW